MINTVKWSTAFFGSILSLTVFTATAQAIPTQRTASLNDTLPGQQFVVHKAKHNKIRKKLRRKRHNKAHPLAEPLLNSDRKNNRARAWGRQSDWKNMTPEQRAAAKMELWEDWKSQGMKHRIERARRQE